MIIVFMDVFYNFFDLLSVNRILYKGTKQGMLNHHCFFLVTSLWGVSRSWGGDVPTLDRDLSGPSLRCLLISSVLLSPTFSFTFAAQCTPRGGNQLLTLLPLYLRSTCPHTQVHSPTWASAVYVPAYRDPLIP